MPERITPVPELSTLTASAQPLLTTLLEQLQPLRATCQQERPFQRLTALALAASVNLGRQTISQLLATLGLTSDWSAFYRLFSMPRLAPEQLAHQLCAASLALSPATGPCVAAVDGVQIPRHSWRLLGSAWLHDPASPVFKRGIHRAQRFTHLALVTPQNAQGYSRAIPVRFDPAVPAKGRRPAGMPPGKEWAVGLEQLHWLRAELDQAGRPEQPLLALADSAWQGAGVWRDLPARTTLLAGCRANRALYALPPAYTGRGRPRCYGERASRPDAWLALKPGWRRTTLVVRNRQIPVSYRVEGPYVVEGAPQQPLFLLVVRGSNSTRGKKRRRARYWLVNAVQRQGRWVLPFPATALLSWAWQRWEIEVTHRELKTGFGVGQSQCWNATSAFLTVQWQVAVYSLLVIAGYRCWGLAPGPLRPPGTWWRGSGRWSLDQLRQALRRELGGVTAFRPVWRGTTGNWWKIADWLTLQSNAIQAAGRL
jgi:hypothetical protein